MAVSEIEVADMNLEPLSAISEKNDAIVLDAWSWKQLSREEQQEIDLVVSTAANADLTIHEVRKIGGRILLFKKCRVRLSSDTISDDSINKRGLSPHNSGTSTKERRPSNKERGHSKRYSDDEILGDLQRLHEELDRSPTRKDIEKYGMCSGQTVYDRFGSIAEAREQAGVGHPETTHKISREDLITELVRVSEKLGRAPSNKDIIDEAEYSPGPYWREFGGIENALVEAGIHSDRSDGPTVEDWKRYKEQNEIPEEQGPEYTEEALLREVQILAESLGRAPRVKDIREKSKYSYSPYQNRWDGIDEVRKAAGVDDYFGIQ